MKFEIFAISFTNFWQIKKAKTFGEKNSAFFFFKRGKTFASVSINQFSVQKFGINPGLS